MDQKKIILWTEWSQNLGNKHIMYHLLFLADVAFIILYGNSETQFGYG